MAHKSKSPKVVGRAVNWTAADIEKLAEITPEDVAAAKATYRRLAPKRAKRLLDAKTKNSN